MNDYCIIVTGLPASGKTTIGRKVAAQLGIPMLDKDDYLEQLYDNHGIGNRAWRTQLSLESNGLFQADAIAQTQVVLVSHWRPKLSDGPSGTSTAWLGSHFKHVIELFCDCPTQTAAQRFVNRKRHPGHLDQNRDVGEIAEWMGRYRTHLPIEIGRLIMVNSTNNVDFDQLIVEIQMALHTGGSQNEQL